MSETPDSPSSPSISSSDSQSSNLIGSSSTAINLGKSDLVKYGLIATCVVSFVMLILASVSLGAAMKLPDSDGTNKTNVVRSATGSLVLTIIMMIILGVITFIGFRKKLF